MKKIVLSFLTLASIVFVKAQPAQFEWARQLGGSGYETPTAIVTDHAGNVYTTGFFFDSTDFDPGPGIYLLPSDGMGVFISKLDADGKFVWAHAVSGDYQQLGYAITLDDSGNVYVAGSFQSTHDFNTDAGVFNMTSAGGDDIFILKLSPAGNFIWAKRMGGAGNDVAHGIVCDGLNGVYLTGTFGWDFAQGAYSADFDPGPSSFLMTSKGSADIFVSRLDASGNLVWAKQMGGIYKEEANAIALDSQGNIYTTGYFFGTTDFDTDSTTSYNLTSKGRFDVFVSKLNSSGNFIWVSQIGGTLDEIGDALITDRYGNICVTGYFKGTVDFDPGAGTVSLGSSGNDDIFILKLNSAGQFIWADKIGASSDERAYAITVDKFSNLYLTGKYRKQTDFDPGNGVYYLNASDTMSDNVFLLKLDSLGKFKWARQIGSNYDDVGNAITVDDFGNIFTAGYFDFVKVDFNPDAGVFEMKPIGDRDIFILKMNQCYFLTNTVTLSGSSLTAKQSGAEYQWLDCSNGKQPISGANASNYTPSKSGNYAVVITLGTCTDTSDCMSVTTSDVNVLEHGNLISVYPNPNTGVFNIELNTEEGEVQFEIYNYFGVLVDSFTTHESKTILDLSSLANGLYVVKAMKGEATIAAQKIIKE